MKTYILQFKYKQGNGWAIINAHSPNQAEQVFYTQTKFDTPNVVSMQESNYYGEEMQLVYEGSVSTLNANLYSLAVLNGFEGSLDDFIQSQKGDKGDTGDIGPQGVGIAKVEQTTTSHESSGENIVTVTLTNGNNYTFSVLNGSSGEIVEQIQSDWEQDDNTKKDYIKNKPSLSTVATSGNYNDLLNKPTIDLTGYLSKSELLTLDNEGSTSTQTTFNAGAITTMVSAINTNLRAKLNKSALINSTSPSTAQGSTYTANAISEMVGSLQSDKLGKNELINTLRSSTDSQTTYTAKAIWDLYEANSSAHVQLATMIDGLGDTYFTKSNILDGDEYNDYGDDTVFSSFATYQFLEQVKTRVGTIEVALQRALYRASTNF